MLDNVPLHHVNTEYHIIDWEEAMIIGQESD